MTQERTKDPVISFRNCIVGKSKKTDELNPTGHDRIQLYIAPDQIAGMIECLNAHIENPRGANIDVHVQKRRNRERGNVFESAYCFVKGVQEPQNRSFGGGAPVGAPTHKFVPKGTASPATADRTAKVHQALIEE